MGLALASAEDRFYVEETDTRRVELGSRLYAPEMHGPNTYADSRRFWCHAENCPANGSIQKGPPQGLSKAERHMASKTTNPFTFLQQVRSETAKVTWPSRRETVISTIMVLVFSVLTMTFFFAADQLMAFAVELILGIGR